MTDRNSRLLVVLAVWLSFLAVSLANAPIPAVNEPHYLTKARHFWDSRWCAGDLFLTSFPAHRVFYSTFGWLTLHFDFSTVAFIGRVLSNGLLAASWTSLLTRLQSIRHGSETDDRRACWQVLLSAWLFLGLQAIGNLSGEWLIGGFESKVLAYAFVFWSITALLDERLIRAAAFGGIAISFHPIVGLWHVAACRIAEVVRRPRTAISRKQSLIADTVLFVTALPGLWPAVQMLREADPKHSYAANFIQVFYRLKHHLDPMDFRLNSYLGYLVLAVIVVCGFLIERNQATTAVRGRWWIGYLAATALFALGGYLAGVGPRPAELMTGYRWRMVLLKFYPFRLFDLFLPITVAMFLPSWLRTAATQANHSVSRRVFSARWLWMIGGAGMIWAMTAHQVFPPPNRLPPQMKADWLDACRWVAKNSPADAVFHTPFEAEAFKWHAQRAEYVNNKDCPQDAAGLVEWNRRQRLITKWSDASFKNDQAYTAKELRELVRKTGVRWAITRTRVHYDADLLYQNDTYKILWLPDDK